MEFKGILASSTDPSELSLTIQGLSKFALGLAAWFAVSKGLDPASAQTQVQAIIDLVAQAIPLVFSLWNLSEGLWGLVRKLFVSFGTK